MRNLEKMRFSIFAHSNFRLISICKLVSSFFGFRLNLLTVSDLVLDLYDGACVNTIKLE